MNQYRIEVFEYTEKGSLKSFPMLTTYATNHEDARVICNEYANELQENGLKKYEVKLSILCYKQVVKDTYFAQFQA